ncbi:restriction endonuclease [Kribbella sp. NPDC056861]|uniref:restriction endonuclease n=1 Tax=Kribbella sp. NPDC056861 TaxID=3154857 RepID=UPI003447BA72
MARRRVSQSDRQRQAAAQARNAEKERKAREREVREAEKERKRQHLISRSQKVETDNARLEAAVRQLRGILAGGIARSAKFDILATRRTFSAPSLDLGEYGTASSAPVWHEFAPRAPGAVSKFFGGQARYEDKRAWAERSFQSATAEHTDREMRRLREVARLRRAHAEQVASGAEETRRHNRAVEALATRLRDRDKAAVEKYLRRVLQVTPLPSAFPRKVELTFSPRTEQVVVQVELPPRSIVPTVASYRYLPTKDEIRPVQRAPKETASLYRDIISQVALLFVRDLFDSDPKLATVAFNGHVHALNPGTGQKEYPCIVSLNVERADFPPNANLRKVDPAQCVRHLNAIVSAHPYELEPIEPILDFDLSKYSFIEGFDAVSTLDSRPDLMEMSPTNFEHLVRQIFVAQGCEGWNTEQSNDDGVDAVIARRTPLMGGLSIVQAKRWSKVVGISHVRELAGAMEEKRAGWGILVTTSWFTAKCWDKAREHGRMELIDGDRLVYLIKEHLAKDVLIGIADRPKPKGNRAAPGPL